MIKNSFAICHINWYTRELFFQIPVRINRPCCTSSLSGRQIGTKPSAGMPDLFEGVIVPQLWFKETHQRIITKKVGFMYVLLWNLGHFLVSQYVVCVLGSCNICYWAIHTNSSEEVHTDLSKWFSDCHITTQQLQISTVKRCLVACFS